jgi:dynein assembly factor 2
LTLQDPENQLTYQTELRQLEKERGKVIHFVNPVGGFVLKTSVDGSKKAFVNVASNTLIKKPSFEVAVQNNK